VTAYGQTGNAAESVGLTAPGIWASCAAPGDAGAVAVQRVVARPPWHDRVRLADGTAPMTRDPGIVMPSAPGTGHLRSTVTRPGRGTRAERTPIFSVMRTSVASAVIAVLLSASLVACSDDKSAVCTSADDLGTAVEDLKNVDVTASNGVSDLQDKLGTVRSDFEQLKSDAKSQFSSQIDTAVADPTVANLNAVRAAAPGVESSVQALLSDVKSTC
jgi:hypothetical protein